MYKPPEWTKKTFELVQGLLRTGHYIQYYGTVHNLDHFQVADLPPILPGSVIEWTKPSWSAVFNVDNTDGSMDNFQGVNARKYMIQAHARIGTGDPDLGILDWPLGWFPVRSAFTDRTTGEATFTCVGKLALARFWPTTVPFTVPKGVTIVEGIKRLMVRGGESRVAMNFPDRPRKLTHDVTVPAAYHDDKLGQPHPTFATKARDLADMLAMSMFYRPDGSLFLHPVSADPIPVNLNEWLVNTDPPNVGAGFGSFYNEIMGLFGKGLKEKTGILRPPPAHPLSPSSLARHDMRFTVGQIHEMPLVQHLKTAETICYQIMFQSLAQTLQIRAEIFPFPFLEEGDNVSLFGATFAPAWSLPLELGKPMVLSWDRVAFRRPPR